MFVHYTKKIDVFLKILSSGLFINQCERKIIRELTNRDEFQRHEPQFFGMTCVRKEGFFGSRKHAKEFGEIGIVFSDEWVFSNGFKSVEYVGDVELENIKPEFIEAITEVDEYCEKNQVDGFHKMAYTNKAMASWLGLKKYHEFLVRYEYMEPINNKYQCEWRYVQPLPLYNSRPTEELVQAVQKPGWSQQLRCLKFSENDITAFVVPLLQVRNFKKLLPDEFKKVPVMSKLNI